MTVTVTDPFSAAGNTPYTLGVYDSACRLLPEPGFQCTGGDDDLATGDRITFPAIKAKEDTPAEGMILVTPQGSGNSFADRVSKALFTFSFGVPTYVSDLRLIDIDEVATNVTMTFNFTGGASSMFTAAKATWVKNANENNSYSFFDIKNDTDLVAFFKPVDSFSVQFGNENASISGGIGGFTATPVPVPAALQMLLTVFGLLGYAARRRKAA